MYNKKVALVGNSSNLLTTNYSKIIDSHDWVIRFNLARVKKFEKYVGSKTSARMVNHHVFTGTTNASLFSEYDVNFIPSIEEPIILCKYLLNFENISKTRNIKVPVSYVKDETYNKACIMLKNQTPPTMGFIAIVFALEIFKNVSIFGFDLDKVNNPSHYWEKTSNLNASNYHNFTIENERIKELIKDKKITHYK